MKVGENLLNKVKSIRFNEPVMNKIFTIQNDLKGGEINEKENTRRICRRT